MVPYHILENLWGRSATRCFTKFGRTALPSLVNWFTNLLQLCSNEHDSQIDLMYFKIYASQLSQKKSYFEFISIRRNTSI
jgi:hypothetical protein